jgi:hypothetical protein
LRIADCGLRIENLFKSAIRNSQSAIKYSAIVIMTLAELAQYLEAEPRGDINTEITGIAPLDEADAGDLTYVADATRLAQVKERNAASWRSPGQSVCFTRNPTNRGASVRTWFWARIRASAQIVRSTRA